MFLDMLYDSDKDMSSLLFINVYHAGSLGRKVHDWKKGFMVLTAMLILLLNNQETAGLILEMH